MVQCCIMVQWCGVHVSTADHTDCCNEWDIVCGMSQGHSAVSHSGRIPSQCSMSYSPQTPPYIWQQPHPEPPTITDITCLIEILKHTASNHNTEHRFPSRQANKMLRRSNALSDTLCWWLTIYSQHLCGFAVSCMCAPTMGSSAPDGVTPVMSTKKINDISTTPKGSEYQTPSLTPHYFFCIKAYLNPKPKM